MTNFFQACGKLFGCDEKGLHAHHPRDCLFYLREFDEKELQGFLSTHNIHPFGTEFKEEPAAENYREPAKEKGLLEYWREIADEECARDLTELKCGRNMMIMCRGLYRYVFWYLVMGGWH